LPINALANSRSPRLGDFHGFRRSRHLLAEVRNPMNPAIAI
jgi:hypothetical protein